MSEPMIEQALEAEVLFSQDKIDGGSMKRLRRLEGIKLLLEMLVLMR